MSIITLKIVSSKVSNCNRFYVQDPWGVKFFIFVEKTKRGKYTLKDINGKTFDKCCMSQWFVSNHYYAICYDKALKQNMIDVITNELREQLIFF